MKSKKTEGGFIHMIILFLVFCVIIWYFKLDVRGFIDSHPQISAFLTRMINFIKQTWNDYIGGVVAFIWKNILVEGWKNIAPVITGK